MKRGGGLIRGWQWSYLQLIKRLFVRQLSVQIAPKNYNLKHEASAL